MPNLIHRIASKFSRHRREADRGNGRRIIRRYIFESLENRRLLAIDVALGNLTIPGSGTNSLDTITIARSGANVRVTDLTNAIVAGNGATQVNPNTVDVPFAAITGRIFVNTLGGNDFLTVDFASGNPIPAGGIDFAGGENTGDDDQLKLTGYSLTTADGVADVSVVHTGPEAGSVILAGLGTVRFTEIEPLTLAGTVADLSITLPVGAESITLGDDVGVQDPNGNTANTSAIYDSTGPAYSFEYTEFINPTSSLTLLSGGAGGNLSVFDLVASGFSSSLTAGTPNNRFADVNILGSVALNTNKSISLYTGSITSTASITTFGGAITLDANSGITITEPVISNGGVQTLQADSDGDGTGTFSLNLAKFNDPNPAIGNQFGATVVVLTSGNVVVTSPGDDFGGSNAGAVYLFNGLTGDLISTLRGGRAVDNIGSGGVITLSNGNYVVRSPNWDNASNAFNAGAVTWGSGTAGVNGVVSDSNSLVGLRANDEVGTSVTALSNGNYVVSSLYWDNGATTNAGAVTWGSGAVGISGAVSASNSLVGSKANDFVGGVTALSNGNYVVWSSNWDNGTAIDVGAVTWGSGTVGISGLVSTSNSLVGSTDNDQVGYQVTALVNGNYVVSSTFWDNGTATDAGAVTWGSGIAGISGVVSASNSLVGSRANDVVGYRVIALSNGNYVTSSGFWDNGTVTDVGAVTWGSGVTGISGAVNASNSLVGSRANDQVGLRIADDTDKGLTALSNGNYVVNSPNWDNGLASDTGAVTWGSGTTGINGVVSTANSIVGSRTNDRVGFGGVTALSNGNYVVSSPNWSTNTANNVGAVTWSNGATGLSGLVSVSNSLVGSTFADNVGISSGNGFIGGVTALNNGNYVVRSRNWDNGTASNAGAVTWGSGTVGISGVVSVSNSLVGSRANDQVGADGVTSLSNGNYVVRSSSWDNGTVTDAGAVTWGSGTVGVKGLVSAANSLVGSTASDQVGGYSGLQNNGIFDLNLNGVTALSNGSYVVRSSGWDNGTVTDAGAVTWGSGTIGISGVVSASNSLVGSKANDQVGMDGVTALSNGNYVVSSSAWDNGSLTNAGAATWGSGTDGVRGVVSSENSVVGNSTNSGSGLVVASKSNVDMLIASFPSDGSGRVIVGSQSLGLVAMRGLLNASAGSISLGAADTNLTGTITSTSSVFIAPQQINRLIDLGTNTAGRLGLTDAELDLISTSSLQIGSVASGTITVSSGITRPTSTNLQLRSGGAIAINTGSINTNGGTFLFDAGTGGVHPISSGTDITASGVSFTSGDELAIHIAGATLNTQYRQLNVSGNVNLSGASLLLTNSFAGIVGNESFTIVNSTGVISGQFNGLINGANVSIGSKPYLIQYNSSTVQLVPNPAPTDIILTGGSVAENSSMATVVGTFATVSPNAANTFTYTRATGTGDTDNESFSIVGNSLRTNTVLDFETKSSYSIRVRTTDQAGLPFEKVFIITVLPVNEFDPQLTSPLTYSITENSVNVVDLTATDQDAPQPTFTYSIVGGADFNRFEMTLGNRLSFVTAPNFEAPVDADGNNQYLVQVAVSDGSRSSTSSLTINVTNVIEAPTNVTLSPQSVLENEPVGTVVGAFTVTNPEAGATAVLSLVDGDGSNGNANFEIFNNNSLRTKASFNFEGSSYDGRIRVRAQNPGGGFLDRTFSITLVDVNEPPTSGNLNLTTAINTPFSFSLPGFDPENGTLTYEITTPFSNGTLTGTGAGRNYSPNNGFVGFDNLYYKVSDGVSFSSEGRIQVNVIGVRPTVHFDVSSTNVSESGGTLQVALTLSAPAPLAFDIPLQFGGTAVRGSDYSSLGSISFPAGATTANFSVQIVNDNSFEGSTPEAATITLVAGSTYLLGTTTTHSINITDNDPQPTVSFGSPNLTVSETQGSISFPVRLSAPSSETITVPIVVTGGSATATDYTLTTPTLTFSPGSVQATATVTIANENLPDNEPTENVLFGFGTIVNGSALSNSQQSITILPASNIPEFRFSVVNQRISEGIGIIEIRGELSQAPTDALTVSASVGSSSTLLSGSDYAANNFQFVFPQGIRTAPIQLILVNDTDAESNEFLELNVTADPDFLIGSGRYTLVVEDNDRPVVNLSVVPGSRWEDAGAIVLTATISASPATEVSIPVSMPTGWTQSTESGVSRYLRYAEAVTDVTGDLGPFVFPANATEAQRTITRTYNIVSDLSYEGDEILEWSLGTTSSLVTLGTSSQRILIRDDDPLVRVSGPSTVNESATSATYTINLSQASNKAVSGTFVLGGDATPGSDYVAPASTAFTIPAGDTTANVSVQLTDDGVAEPHERLILNLGSVTNGIIDIAGASHRLTIRDDDAALPSVFFSPVSTIVNGGQEQAIFGFNLSEASSAVPLTVNLSRVSTRDVFVEITTTGLAVRGQDFQLTGTGLEGQSLNVLRIPAGQTSVVFNVVPINDSNAEGSEPFSIRLNSAENGTIVNGLAVVQGEVTDGLLERWYGANNTLSPSTLESLSTNLTTLAEQLTVPGASGAIAGGTFTTGGQFPVGSLVLPVNSLGLLEGATLFFDANFNGVQDSGEVSGVTRLDGSLSLTVPLTFDTDNDGSIEISEGRWVSVGGTDTSVGLPQTIRLAAPVGVYAVTPLTTLVERLVRTPHSLSLGDALARATNAFGIAGYDLSTSNTLYEILSNNALAAKAYKPHVQVHNTTVLIGELFAGLTNSTNVDGLGTQVYDLMASRIALSGSSLDLSLTSVVRGLLDSMVTNNVVTITPTVLDGVATLISRGNALIESMQLSNFASSTLYAEQILKAKKVIQGELKTAMNNIGRGTLTIGDALSQFSDTQLQTNTSNATITMVVPASIGVADAVIKESEAGSKVLEFSVVLSGPRSTAVSVSYTTKDDSALSGSDYESRSGVLTWTLTDRPTKVVQVPIESDSGFEADERVRLLLSNATGAIVRRSEGFGFILNDDTQSVTANSTAGENKIVLAIDKTTSGLTQSGVTINSGLYTDPYKLNLNGLGNQSDQLTLDYNTGFYRADSIEFAGGAGPGDTLAISGGIFPTIEYSITGVDSSRLRLVPASVSERSTVTTSGLESASLNVSQVGTLIIRVPASITELRIEDADANTTGRMRIVSVTPANAFAPIEFVNPTTKILILQDNLDGTVVTRGTLDTGFTPGSSGIEEAKSGVYLSNNSINENRASGSVIGSIQSREFGFDGGTFAVALVAGDGSTDNSSFQPAPNRDLATGSSTVLDFETKNNFSIRVKSTSSTTGESIEIPMAIQVNNLPELAAPVQIGHIAGSNQRSIVRNIVMKFDSEVTIEPDAFLVHQRTVINGVPNFTNVNTAFTPPILVNGQWTTTLSFSGPLTTAAGNLLDGNYRLTIDASKVRLGTTNFDGDKNGIAGGDYVLGADQFFAFFGDTNGDRIVGISEFAQFRSAFGKSFNDVGFNELFDFDGLVNGVRTIGQNDFGQFRARYGRSLGS